MRRRRTDAGQITVVLVGFFLVLGLLAAAVIDASAAYLRRESLNSLADGAVLAAADGVQGEQVYTGGLGDLAQVDPEVAQRYVADYLRQTGALSRYPGLTWAVRSTGDSVTVRVAAPLRLPLSPPGWGDAVVITADASAVVPVH